MRDIQDALKYHLDHLLERGYEKDEVLGIFVYGSQNYNFAHEGSDIDTKAIIIPSWDRLVNEPQISKEYHWENGEHCEVKDIREFNRMLYKQNVNFLEVLYTDYAIINSEFKEFWDTRILPLRDRIVRYNVNYGIASICGQAIHTLHQAELKPQADDSKKFGNALRLFRYLQFYKKGVDYRESIELPDSLRNEFIGYKTGEKIADLDMITNLKEMFIHEKEQNQPTFEDVKVRQELDMATSDLIWYKVLKDRSGYSEIDFI